MCFSYMKEFFSAVVLFQSHFRGRQVYAHSREVLALKGCRAALPQATVCLMAPMLCEKWGSTIAEDTDQLKDQ